MNDKAISAKRILTRQMILHSANSLHEVQSTAEDTALGNTSSPEEYGEDKIQQTTTSATGGAANLGSETTSQAYHKWSAKKEQSFSERRAIVRRKLIQTEVVERKAETAISSAPVKSAEGPAAPIRQALKKQTALQGAVNQKLSQTAKRELGNVGQAAMKAALPKGPALTFPQAIRTRLVYAAKILLLKLKAMLAAALRAAFNALIALLGGGGVVLLLAMVVGAAAAVIGSPMGILFADESGDPNSIPVAEIVRETNAEFAQAMNEIVDAHPECSEVDIQYDYEDGHTWASYWPEVLAVFAVDTNLNGDNDVVVIDEAKKEQIKNTFWEMHQIEYEIETIEVEPDPFEEPADSEDEDSEQEASPAPSYIYILHISVSSLSVEELAADKLFSADQIAILHELLSEEMRPMLVALCGGLPVGDGELVWPLPGYSYISCHFGQADAFGNAGHKGIDIPAPAGTLVLAAHSGTVMISGWNDSYGNQVLLDDGAGLSTRYAHLISTAVSAGTFVSAGDVIGYVGTTGDSTGNHLHWEVYVGGVRVDPLGVVG